jgi:hypothetical protein
MGRAPGAVACSWEHIFRVRMCWSGEGPLGWRGHARRRLCHMVSGGCSLWGRDPAPQNVWRGRTQARWRARARAGVACRLRFLTLRRPLFPSSTCLRAWSAGPVSAARGACLGALSLPRVCAAGPPYLYTKAAFWTACRRCMLAGLDVEQRTVNC